MGIDMESNRYLQRNIMGKQQYSPVGRGPGSVCRHKSPSHMSAQVRPRFLCLLCSAKQPCTRATRLQSMKSWWCARCSTPTSTTRKVNTRAWSCSKRGLPFVGIAERSMAARLYSSHRYLPGTLFGSPSSSSILRRAEPNQRDFSNMGLVYVRGVVCGQDALWERALNLFPPCSGLWLGSTLDIEKSSWNLITFSYRSKRGICTPRRWIGQRRLAGIIPVHYSCETYTESVQKTYR